ncbi:endoplasmic reticulum protein SC65-like isoform X1 [Amphiprion ocellaris]|uniref:endoplasmic reticulum protein SC65-like isoform X1 n=1 Tax=Amphiprion ocellaris TaxID=80972 RepID=UPI0024111571|nr:endoplasmic reticulum protein SC65-like isoform X1 [Amphiprion ocellaris]XP_054860732.1 endoplasmic reticulum protein SC65-like isoform X1 [Amphiprion ocellaris]
MVTLCAKGDSLFILLCVTFVFMSAAQYENYNFRNFPEEELMPLTAAYGKALDNYAAGNWTESIRYLELSLRLHRFLRDSVRFCVLHCNRSEYDEPAFSTDTDLRVFWHVMMRASCLKKCRAHFPALQLPPPGREILEDFNRRSVYRYLHAAHSKLNNLQQAVPCAFTFLQRNPEDQEMQQLMEDYKKQYDLSGFLIDHEERPYEASFLQGVKLISSGDYSSSVEQLEETLKLYLQEYDLCQSDCEDISQLSADRDFYAVIADVYVDVLRCKLKCEENLMPNIGGYFVEKFVATVYHYLQYAYYKLNDGRSAVPCVYSYFLFEPEDQVMKQNLQYYKAYSEQWGLQTDHFTPRREAFRHYNQTATQKQMLTFAEMYVKMSDEDFLGAEEAALLAPQSPDVEFEGIGDYEESFYANWRQPKGKGDAGEES